MPSLTVSGSPTNNGDSSFTINTTGADRVIFPVTTAAGSLDETQSWFAIRFRAGESMATMAARQAALFWWADASGTWLIGFLETNSTVRMLRANAGVGTPVSLAASWSAGDDITVVYAWTATAVKVSVNGSVFTSLADANIPVLSDTTVDIAATDAAARQLNSAVWWTAAGTGALTDADAATLHGFGNTDPSWASVPGTRIFLWKAVDLSYEDTGTTDLTVTGVRATATATAQPGSPFTANPQVLTTSGTPTNNTDSSYTINTTGADIVQFPASLIDETQAWYAIRFRAGESMATMAARSPTPVLFYWANSSGTWLIGYVEGDQSVRMLRAVGGVGNPVSKSATWALNGDVTIVYAWTATTLKVSVNGSVFTTLADANIPVLTDTTVEIAGIDNGTRELNSAVWWVAAGLGEPTDTDALTLHSIGNTDPAFSALPAGPTFLWKANDLTYETPGAVTSLTPPTVTGALNVGGTLTVDPGTWSPTPASFAYYWQRADDVLGTNLTGIGATGSTYTLESGDVGKFLRAGVVPS